jgi:GT2 family glycosyltransferase
VASSPQSSSPRGNSVVIAVLTWNGYKTTVACLASLKRMREWPVPVVVIDNGSRDPEGERLAMEFGFPVVSMRLDPNQGVPGGYNAGIQWAAASGFSHVLLMNNDTLVSDERMLTCLLEAAEPDVAAIAPITLDADGEVYSAGGTVSWWMGLSRHRKEVVRSDVPYPATWLDGPCLLVSIDAARWIGGLDETFVTYWEDTDWCVRASRAGYRCLVDPRVSIVHLRGGGTKPSDADEFMHLRNRVLFLRRNGTRLQNVVSMLFLLVVHTPIFVIRRFKRPRIALAAVRDAYLWNIRDAMRFGGWLRRPADGPRIGEFGAPAASLDTGRPATASGRGVAD